MPANFPGVVATLLANSALLFTVIIASPCNAATPASGVDPGSQTHEPTHVKPPLDVSGKKRIGKASFYANRFGGRTMADGNRMNLKGNNAASKTLPLGTTA